MFGKSLNLQQAGETDRSERSRTSLKRLVFVCLGVAAISASTASAAASKEGPFPPPTEASMQTPPQVAAPVPSTLMATGGTFESDRLTLQLQCLKSGTATLTWAGAGEAAIDSAPFACTRYHSSVSLALRTSESQLTHMKDGLHLVLDLRSGTARLSVPITLRLTPPSRTLQSMSASAGIFEPSWEGATANAVSSGEGSGGQITVGPFGWATLGVHSWGERVWWRAWLYSVNEQTGERGWLADPSGWHSYSPYPNGAKRSGAGIDTPDSGVTVYVAGLNDPGTDPSPASFTVGSGWYVSPVIESWSASNGYATRRVPVVRVAGNVLAYSPNWLIFR
jgi:hypothetical protein